MKEENKVLRQVVEQTMKEYHDLQMKFALIKQNKQNKVNPTSHVSYRLRLSYIASTSTHSHAWFIF